MASKPAPFGRTSPTESLQAVDESELLELLTDDRCRAILEAVTDEPRTAGELIDDLEIPRSTLYRKVDALVDAELLSERTRIGASGNHQSEYVRQFEEVSLRVDFCSGVDLRIENGRTADSGPGVTIGASAD